MNSKSKGNIGETRFIYEFTKRGIQVSLPIGDNAPYDLIIDFNNKLYKVQIKYSDCKLNLENSITCPVCSKNLKIKDMKASCKARTYVDDIDLIGIYFNQWDKLVLIPIQEININTIGVTFRITPPKNNQSKGIKFIDDYTIDKWLESLCVETLHKEPK